MSGPRELRIVMARAAAQVGEVRDPGQPGREGGPQLGKRLAAPHPPGRVPPGDLVICRLIMRGRLVAAHRASAVVTPGGSGPMQSRRAPASARTPAHGQGTAAPAAIPGRAGAGLLILVTPGVD